MIGYRQLGVVCINFNDVARFRFQLLLKEIRQAHFADETEPLTVLFVGGGQVDFLSQSPDFWFGQFSNGKMGFIELGLCQLAQKVALVLVGVNACQ